MLLNGLHIAFLMKASWYDTSGQNGNHTPEYHSGPKKHDIHESLKWHGIPVPSRASDIDIQHHGPSGTEVFYKTGIKGAGEGFHNVFAHLVPDTTTNGSNGYIVKRATATQPGNKKPTFEFGEHPEPQILTSGKKKRPTPKVPQPDTAVDSPAGYHASPPVSPPASPTRPMRRQGPRDTESLKLFEKKVAKSVRAMPGASAPVEGASRHAEVIHHPNFINWFGDWRKGDGNHSKVLHPMSGEPHVQHAMASAVVGKDNAPKPVFHGASNANFRAFDPAKQDKDALYGPGFYFTEHPQVAAEYQKKGAVAGAMDPGVHSVYLNIRKPFHADDTKLTGDYLDHVAGRLNAVGHKATVTTQGIPGFKKKVLSVEHRDAPRVFHTGKEHAPPAFQWKEGMSGKNAYDTIADYAHHAHHEFGSFRHRGTHEDMHHLEAVNNLLKDVGHDGITHVGGQLLGNKKQPHKVWIAFHPHQIKHTENEGTFSPHESDFYKGVGDNPPSPFKVGDKVVRKGDHRVGQITETYNGSHRVQWGKNSTSLKPHLLEKYDPDVVKQRVKAVIQKRDSARAHYSYCATHHNRIDDDGTCYRCEGKPSHYYTLGNRTPRPIEQFRGEEFEKSVAPKRALISDVLAKIPSNMVLVFKNVSEVPFAPENTNGVNTPPSKTVKAYKLFRTHPDHPGKLFPLFVNADKPVEMNKWANAEVGPMKDGKVKSKIGPLAMRPGWHAGDLPVATHIGGKSSPKMKIPDHRPDNHVWAEVEMPNDVDWQQEANSRAEYDKKGKMIPKTAHITDRVPEGGHYRYKTNPNMTGNWLIGGAMKVNRVLPREEVNEINRAHGVHDLPTMDELRSGARR